MTKTDRIKLLLDYNKFLKECVSTKSEINKDSIRDYLKGSYYHQPIKLQIMEADATNKTKKYNLNLKELNKGVHILCEAQIKEVRKEIGSIIFSRFKYGGKDEQGFIQWDLAKEIHEKIFETGWVTLDLSSKFYKLGSESQDMLIKDFYPKILRMGNEIEQLKKTISYLEKKL